MYEIKMNNGKAMYGLLDLTDEPILDWVTADLKRMLRPSFMEKRKNWIDCVDEENGLFEVYVDGELQEIVRGYDEAQRVLGEYEQRQFDMEEACQSDELDF